MSSGSRVDPGRPPPNGRHAAFYRPGAIDEEEEAVFALAGTGKNLLQEAVLAGLLRHEVRHAEQGDELGQVFFNIYDLAELACQWKVCALPRGGILYGLIPAEMDANAAAAKVSA
jgi:hypothetical protein